MIEVNLLPGGKKRAARGKRPSISLPSFGALQQDPWVLGAVAAGVVGVGVVLWLFLSVGSRREEAEVALQQALADSARYSEEIARTNTLLASRDSIVQRVAVIQEIDQGRYIWPHIMDEVSRALPDYTWIQQLQQTNTGSRMPRIRVTGRAGSIEAMTVFMDQLEASPFLRNVSTRGADQVEAENQLIWRYDLEMDYEQPPIEFLETVPLLDMPSGDAGPASPGL